MIAFFLIIYFFLIFYFSYKLKYAFNEKLLRFMLFRDCISAMASMFIIYIILYFFNIKLNIQGKIIDVRTVDNYQMKLFVFSMSIALFLCLLFDIVIMYVKRFLDWLYEALSNLFKNK